MADAEHVDLISQGINAWNANRPDRPNLYGAILTGAILPGANLTGANLASADLRDADLSGADLRASLNRGCEED